MKVVGSCPGTTSSLERGRQYWLATPLSKFGLLDDKIKFQASKARLPDMLSTADSRRSGGALLSAFISESTLISVTPLSLSVFLSLPTYPPFCSNIPTYFASVFQCSGYTRALVTKTYHQSLPTRAGPAPAKLTYYLSNSAHSLSTLFNQDSA